MKILKMIIKLALIVFAALILAVLVINGIVRHSAGRYILDHEDVGQGYDCILVLGCGVRGTTPSPMLEDRLLRALEIYDGGASDRLLMSGDNSKIDYDEVNVMKDFAVKHGVASDVIFMDHAGLSTYESVYRAKEIFKVKRVLIVTQEYHLYRAVYTARAMGLDAYGVASDLRVYRGQIMRDCREVLARVKDFVYCIVKPEPSFLGETIPIWGDGNVTNDN